MKSFLFLLALGLASSDKLDRTYLPPPGSQFSGGSPGSLEVPLEYPKETYSTTLRPLTSEQNNSGLSSPGDSQLTVGINRGTGIQNGAPGSFPVTPGPNSPFTYFQNAYKVPTTTTSYAYTQLTTFPPSDGFETTISPVSPTNFPDILHQTGISHPLNQGQISSGYTQPGFLPGNNHNQPGFGFQPLLPDGQAFVDRPTGSQQPQILNQYQQGLPGSTVSPIYGNNAQSPGFTQTPTDYNQGFTQHLGVQPPKQLIVQPGVSSTGAPQTISNYQPGPQQFGSQIPTQFIGQQSSLPSTITPQNVLSNQPGSLQYEGNPNMQGSFSPGIYALQQQGGQLPSQYTGPQNYFPTTVGPARFPSNSNQYGSPNNQITAVSNVPQIFDGQEGIFPSISSPNFPVNQQGTPHYEGNFNIQGTMVPSSNVPQVGSPQLGGHQASVPQGLLFHQPGVNQYVGDLDSIPGTSSGSDVPTGDLSYQPGQPGGNNQQQFSTQNNYQDDRVVPQLQGSTVRPFDAQNVYRPDSIAPSSVVPPGYYNQSIYPSSTPTKPTYGISLGNVPSSIYPSITNQDLTQTEYSQRPERPQAESDRSAFILEYKNILTPEGYEYSFDTSNGIHADENGTAIDGVKAQGSYSYIGDDGKVYSIVYSADENGFRPQGDHLPTPPPVPEAIKKVIEQAAKDKEAGIIDDGSYNDAKYGHKKYQGVRNRPKSQNRILKNGADIPGDYKTKYSESGDRKIGAHAARKPISVVDDTLDEYDDEINDSDRETSNTNNEGAVTKRPGYLPIRHPLSKQQEQDEYDLVDDRENIMNEREKPSSSQIENVMQIHSNNNNSRRRRPMKQGHKKDMQNHRNYSGSQDFGKEFADKFQDYESEPDLISYKKNPSSTFKPFKTGTKYIVDENETINSKKKLFPSGKHQGSKRPSYSGSNYEDEVENSDLEYKKDYGLETSNEPSEYIEYQKPGSAFSGIPKENKRPNSSTTRYKDTTKPGRPGVSIIRDKMSNDSSDGVQQKGRPAFGPNVKLSKDQQTSSIDVRYPQPTEEETGYEYNPPQNKFVQDETNRFPSRFSEMKQTSSTSPPTIKHKSTTKKTTTIQPFMTPNIYDEDDDESYEDTSDKNLSRKPFKVTGIKTTFAPTSQTDSDKYEPDQQIGDEIITSIVERPGKPVKTFSSTTRRPFYEQDKTMTPNYEYEPAEKNRVTQKVDRNRRPGQREGSTKKPGSTYLPSTTPISYYTKKVTKSEYPTTYTDDTTSDSAITGRPGAQRTEISRVPGKISSRPETFYSERTYVPSSTTTSRPGTSKLSGRPSSAPSIDYSDESITSLSTTQRPKSYGVTASPTSTYKNRTAGPNRLLSNTDYVDRTRTPGLKPSTPNRISALSETENDYNLPSTTYRPYYSLVNNTNKPGQLNKQGEQERLVGQTGINQFEQPQYSPIKQPGLTGQQGQAGQRVDQFGRTQPGRVVDQFGQPQPGQISQSVLKGQPGQPEKTKQFSQTQQGQNINQFARPQPSEYRQPGLEGQRGQTAQQLPGQMGYSGQTVNQFDRPQPGQDRQPSQVIQPGQVKQLGLVKQPGQLGQTINQLSQSRPGQIIGQFGQTQPGQVGQPGLVGQSLQTVDQFGRPQQGQSGQERQITGQTGQILNKFVQPGQVGQPGKGQVDQFGRLESGQIGIQYGQNQPGLVGQPGQNVDQSGRPLRPGQQTQPELIQTVDQYGRLIPTSQPSQEIGSTFHPDYSTPTQEPSTTYTGNIQSSQTPVTFKPNEPRFGGQAPTENGLNRGQVPAYLGPYQTSTERVIGEDFSGPKQPQRFDPETGYHY